MSDTEFASQYGQTRVSGPARNPFDDGRGEEVDIHPAGAAAMEATRADELDDVSVGKGLDLVHLLVGGEELGATAAVTD